jgi:hypothetical protein
MQGWSQDLIKALSQGGNKVKVKDIVSYIFNITKISKLQRAVRVKALPKGWRDYFNQPADKTLSK